MSTPDAPTHDVAEATDSAWLQVFREVLDSADVDADTNFFQAGGHSLLIPKLLTRYEALVGWRPPVSLLFKFPSPRELEAQSTVLHDAAADRRSR